MGDAAWLRSAVGTAHAATQRLGLLEDVTVEQGSVRDGFGTVDPTAATPELHQALVQRKRGSLETAGGLEVKYQAIVSFVAPVEVDENTRVILSDGTTGPLFIPEGGLTDSTTGQPYLRTVYLRR